MPIVANIVSWLRAGYPEGVPEVDYLPLFALLGRHLTEDEVPLDVDIARVRAHLAAGGWPLADVRSS